MTMHRKSLRAQLIIDENKCLKVYRDNRGYLTAGIGHLVTKYDDLVEDQLISEDRCEMLFNTDVDIAVATCYRLISNFDALPEVAQEVLANMAFNLGETKLKQFHNMLDAAKNQEWARMATQMRQSVWYYQVGNRSKRLIARIMSLVPTQKGLK